MLDKEVQANSTVSAVNDADKLAKLFTIVPNFMIKFLVGTLKLLDKLGLLAANRFSKSARSIRRCI
ncbi:MAG: hypothetical protein MZU97_00595 [Bacillus subtilis]|nr:hypothetical protein [Bacillus subtilis]